MNGDHLSQLRAPRYSEWSKNVCGHNASSKALLKRDVRVWYEEHSNAVEKIRRRQEKTYKVRRCLHDIGSDRDTDNDRDSAIVSDRDTDNDRDNAIVSDRDTDNDRDNAIGSDRDTDNERDNAIGSDRDTDNDRDNNE